MRVLGHTKPGIQTKMSTIDRESVAHERKPCTDHKRLCNPVRFACSSDFHTGRHSASSVVVTVTVKTTTLMAVFGIWLRFLRRSDGWIGWIAVASMMVAALSAACVTEEEETVTPTSTATPAATMTPTPAPTLVPTPTLAPTPIPIQTSTPTPVPTPTSVPTPVPTATLTPPPTPTATPTPGPLRVVRGPTRLTVDDAAFPVWSPGGARIAFLSSEGQGGDGLLGIYVMNADGSNPTSLVSSAALEGNLPLELAWSPDGSKIAFTSRGEDNSDIYVINADGSNLRRLAESEALEQQPQWSPDGTRIVFISTFMSAQADQGNSDIYLMNADGSGIIQLTDHPKQDQWPFWLPGGREIAFQSDRDGYDAIYVINVDGSNLRRLAQVRLEPLQEDFPLIPGFHGRVSWSPDGKRIASYSGTGAYCRHECRREQQDFPALRYRS